MSVADEPALYVSKLIYLFIPLVLFSLTRLELSGSRKVFGKHRKSFVLSAVNECVIQCDGQSVRI